MALVSASRSGDKDALVNILGPDALTLIYSGDKVADQLSRDRFVKAYDLRHELRKDTSDKYTLVVGEEEWPMPIPLVHDLDGWRFDSDVGKEEILNRRIGRNELNVLEVCQAYIEAQEEFSALHVQRGQGREYAQRFQSQPGRHDGLYWPSSKGHRSSPLGPFLANAAKEGYVNRVLSKHSPYHGYNYKILNSQGPHAPGGVKDYIVHGHMTGGFALMAYPDRYNDSGIMTFIVNQNGIIYEKNLGFETAEIVQVIRQYDPDDTWHVVSDE